MARDTKQWKKLNRNESGGGYMYIGAQALERLADEKALDLDDPIEYSLSVGESDGRARAFVGLRNPEETGEGD